MPDKGGAEYEGCLSMWAHIRRAGIFIACTSAAAFCIGVAIQAYIMLGPK